MTSRRVDQLVVPLACPIGRGSADTLGVSRHARPIRADITASQAGPAIRSGRHILFPN